MKISSLLLSSAAILVVGSAFAADLPAKKAAPAAMAAATGCPAFGAGYFAIPGSETCIKIGGYIRSDNKYTANIARGTAPYTLTYKYILGFDTKSNSEVGTINGRVGILDSAGTIATESAYVEMGGLRAGYAPSYVDFDRAYNNIGLAYQPTGVGLVGYTMPMGSTNVSIAAETSQDDNYTAASGNNAASRPDLIAAVSSKMSDVVTINAGLVSHEVVGSSSGTAQGFAALGRTDITAGPVKLILNAAYGNGANGYVDGNAAAYKAMGTAVADSASDSSNLSTATMYAAALEYAMGANVAYAFYDAEKASQDTNTYKRLDYGVGFKYTVAKGLYIRPEIYQVVENANAASDTTTNYFYLRIRRDF